jgi:hypothetical protein
MDTGIEQEYILLILNCDKYREKAMKQKRTWLTCLPSFLIYYHIIGNPQLSSEFVFDNDNRILFVKTADDYNSLPHKIVSAYMAIHKTFKFKYVFKTDDDQVLKDPMFFETLKMNLSSLTMTTMTTTTSKTSTTSSKPIKKYHYGGKVIDVQIPYLSKYNVIHPELPNNMVIKKTKYCNGRFYFLSSTAILNIICKSKQIITEYLEDYAIGLYLDTFFKENIMHINTDLIFVDDV